MPTPAGPLPTPTTARTSSGTTARPNAGTTPRPVSGTASPTDQGHTT